MRHEIVCRRFSKWNVKHLYVCCKAKLAVLVMTWVSLHLFCSLLNKKQIRKPHSSWEKHSRNIRRIQRPALQEIQMRTACLIEVVVYSSWGSEKHSALTFSKLLQRDSNTPYDPEPDRLPLPYTKLLRSAATMFIQLVVFAVACLKLALLPLPVFVIPIVLALEECSVCRSLKSVLFLLPSVKDCLLCKLSSELVVV